MELREQLNGIQHVGIPTNDIEMTIAFYEKLGFEIAFRTVNEAADEKVAFLKLGTTCDRNVRKQSCSTETRSNRPCGD